MGRAELFKLCERLLTRAVTPDEFETIFACLDDNGDGRVDYAEFLWWWNQGCSLDAALQLGARHGGGAVASRDLAAPHKEGYDGAQDGIDLSSRTTRSREAKKR